MKIYFTTDFHASFGIFPHLFEYLEIKKSSETLILDSGDMLGESYYTNILGEEYFRDAIEIVYDAICPGNHGFLFSVTLNNAVCCNLVNAGKLVCNNFLTKNTPVGKIAITGIIGEEAFNAVPKNERDEFSLLDPLHSLDNIIKHLPEDVLFLILLSHSGVIEDVKLLKSNKFPIICLAGHCHSGYFYEVFDETVIAMAPDHGKAVGLLDIDNLLENYCKIAPEFIELKNCDIAEEVSSSNISRKIREIDRLPKISEIEVSMHLYEHRKDKEKYETIILGLILEGFGADYAIVLNKFIFRNVPQDKTITMRQLYEFIPFDNKIAFSKKSYLNGRKLKLALESSDNYIVGNIETANYIVTSDYFLTNHLSCSSSIINDIGLFRNEVKLALDRSNGDLQGNHPQNW